MGDVLQRLRRNADEVFEGTPVLFAYVFGSVARGEARPDSDVDIAVYVEPDRDVDTLRLRLRLPGRIHDVAGVAHIDDVLILNEARLELVGRVLRDGVAIYSRDDRERLEFETTQRSLFLDFEVHAVPLTREFLTATAEGRR